MGRFPSGQRGQTVNLLQLASMVRIHLCPLKNLKSYDLRFLHVVRFLPPCRLIGLGIRCRKYSLPRHRIRPALCVKAIADTSAVVVELVSYRRIICESCIIIDAVNIIVYRSSEYFRAVLCCKGHAVGINEIPGYVARWIIRIVVCVAVIIREAVRVKVVPFLLGKLALVIIGMYESKPLVNQMGNLMANGVAEIPAVVAV